MNKAKFYLFPRQYDKARDTLLVKLLLSDLEEEGGLFQKINTRPFRNHVEWVDDPKGAEYLVLSIDYSKAIKIENYIESFYDFANKNDLRPIIINHGDYSLPLDPKGGYVLRTSAYKSELLSNEVIIPAFVEDLGEKFGYEIREKKAKIPTVGFTGMVKLPSLFQEFKYHIRLVRQWLKIHVGGASPASYQGLFYRRIAVDKIQKSLLCKPLFFIRDSFGRSLKTINVDPEQSRKEFIDSIVSSDLALVIRGDGNFSLRFFEVLSLGRIPLFIDTDSPLPLENEIDYDSFIVRVKHEEIGMLPEKILEFWVNCTPEKYANMQREARRAFVTLLRADAFYRKFFTELGRNKSA